MRLQGLHHITAITGDAQQNLDFYTRVLGLRLAAKTVNQDDPSVYHLFYADERGRPGADGIATERAGDDALRFADPEGRRHELAVRPGVDEPLSAEHPEIPIEHALQGFDAVRAYSTDPERSRALLEQVLDAKPVGDATWELRGERRGATITYDPAPAEPGRQSAGTVHHVAWGTSQADHPKRHERVQLLGIPNSGIVDRHYFHSIYFREPSGVLFELADDGPGFTVDVPLDQLGSVVILPPRFEPHRAEIEKRLTPLPDPRAGWATTSSSA